MNEALAFFGAFNPPTAAHLSLAYFALEKTGRNRVVFVPSQSVYIRDNQGKDFAYDDNQRLRMLRKAAESRPWMTVTDWEMRQERQPRTYETLCHLREEGIHAALLMGSDKLPELAKGWRYVEEIAREFGIVCLPRNRDECTRLIQEDSFLKPLAPCIHVLDTPEATQDISSSRVRQLVKGIGKMQAELADMVPPEILPLL